MVELCPCCPAPFEEPLLSGLPEGGAAASGGTDGETGVASGFALGTVLGFWFGVKLGLVPGVVFGSRDGSADVSGGIVLLGLAGVLLGEVVVLGVVLCGLV